VAPFFAEDPLEGGNLVPVERPGAQSWHELSLTDPDLAAWCAARWLGAWRRLEPLTDDFSSTRLSLHRLAEHVLAPARYAACGKIGLRYTRDGFGTPYFGPDRQVRVAEGALVVEAGDHPVRQTHPTSLRDAAHFAGVDLSVPPSAYAPTTRSDPDAPLAINPDAALALADWFGFCTSAIEQLRSESPDAGRTQLWPEHFDVAVDLGDEARGGRANFGGSPGDEAHPLPYLYVGPWVARSGPFWNEPFGASLSYDVLLASDDQRESALSFLRRGLRLLAG